VNIKICGITNAHDAQCAINLGATHLGFILYPHSPRYCTPEQICMIIQTVGAVNTVGVFVDESPAIINQIVKDTGITHVQLHGNESVEDCNKISVPVIKAFRVATAQDLEPILAYKNSAHYILLDTYVKGHPGGTGQSFNWALAVKAKEYGFPLFLSGGLTPKTVRDAIDQVQPDGVDVSSGVERVFGGKDPQKVAEFIKNARLKKL
jgi:phosphoribosylanthranilate isomerase